MVSAGAMLLAAAVLLPAPESVPLRLEVDMQVESGVDLDATSLRAITKEAQRIWESVLDVHIMPVSAGRRPNVPGVLRLVVTNRTLSPRDGSGLGWIEFVDGEPRDEITVSAGSARLMMQNGRWFGTPFSSLPPTAATRFLERALGRAIAHEIGHYLLRTASHEKHGLMRPVLTADEVMDTRDSLVRLSPEAVARLRQPAAYIAGRGIGRPAT